ncbi:MAG TPA: serine/threonine-protein kinase, partial [Steroidobacteraceae bacterium]|nr:serine/threonine-protein kinase [Steroidobacteraceae bacterium]
MSDESFSGTTVRGVFGESFGRYQLRDRLGSGGFAEVYRAYDPEFEREVALKVILSHLAADNDFVERFVHEMRVAARLSHPAIVPVHDVGRSSSGRPFFTMALLSGESLSLRLRRGSPVTPEEALRILTPIASALDYLAEGGLVHRDLKPANIIVSPRGEGTLIDFGIARVAAATVHLTQTGALVGTPAYMAPEQILGHAIGPAVDRYALGVVAYELLSGRPPFGGDTAQILYRQVHELPAPLDHLHPPLPAPVSRALDWALLKDPAQRPATAAAFLAAFRSSPASVRLQDRVTEPLVPRNTPAPRPGRERSRFPLIAAAAGALTILLAAVVVLLVMRRGGNAPAPSNPPLAAATATAAVPAAISGASTPASSAGQSAAAASATAAVVVTQIPPAATAPATPAATL